METYPETDGFSVCQVPITTLHTEDIEAARSSQPSRFSYPRYASLAPGIHHRLPCDIRHRYRRYRPRYLHRPRGRSGNGYGGHAELTAGYFVDDSLMLINVVLYVIN